MDTGRRLRGLGLFAVGIGIAMLGGLLADAAENGSEQATAGAILVCVGFAWYLLFGLWRLFHPKSFYAFLGMPLPKR